MTARRESTPSLETIPDGVLDPQLFLFGKSILGVNLPKGKGGQTAPASLFPFPASSSL